MEFSDSDGVFLVMVMVMVVPNGVLGKFCDYVVTCVETTLAAAGFIKISDIWFYHDYGLSDNYYFCVTIKLRLQLSCGYYEYVFLSYFSLS